MYYKELFSQAWFDTWEFVIKEPLRSIGIATAIFVISIVLHWYRKGFDQLMKDTVVIAVEGAAATIILFVVVFVVHVFVLTPKHRYETVAAQVAPTPEQSPRIRLDVADEESRKEISDLKKQLVIAQETIKQQQSERDPFSAPIASARFTLLINFVSIKEAASNYFGPGAAVLFASSTETMLSGGVAQHTSDGNGHSQAVIECPFDSPAIGKPIRSLAEAKFIGLQFSAGFVPADTELAPSRAVLLINNQINLTFEIPAQRVIQKIVAAGGAEGTSIVLTDIRKGLAPLVTQPSPTPDKEEPKH
jgi:hypothetical protein